MTKAETYESLQELHADQFETIEEEYNYYGAQLHALESEYPSVQNNRERGGIRFEMQQLRSKLGRLKPHLKDERRTLHGKPIGQRTRHDVMEDMLVELAHIRKILHERLPREAEDDDE